MDRVIVIGGGAAGLAAAISAAECGDDVLLLERMDRVGRKLLATGNGRCNLMNTLPPRYPGGTTFAAQVLSRCGAEEQTRFWRHHGLMLRQQEGGRVYPVSGQASSVLDVLRLAAERVGVKTVVNAAVTELTHNRKTEQWSIKTAVGMFSANRVIVAGGGCAQPKLGSDGSCYSLLKALGHRMTSTRPALTQIETETDSIRGLSGIRVKAAVTVLRMGIQQHQESGELLFADYGISGVCVMQCARYASPEDEVSIDLLPGIGMDRQSLLQQLLRRTRDWGNQSAEQLLTGLVVPRLALSLMKVAGVRCRERLISGMKPGELEAICATVSDFRLRVTGIRGFEQAQVTAGGIRCEDFDPGTMTSLLVRGLHAAGEVLDVDGDCGGFNLMFAFGSGILAGLNGRPIPIKEEH